ncbi:MAG: hypothetical protein V8S34_08020 [Lawsonibacter sp.]
MKQELRQGNAAAISARLRGSWRTTWTRGEQSILFLNRRGASRMVSCGECGQVPECPRCSVKLTYHSANGGSCATTAAAPSPCPGPVPPAGGC